MYARCMRLSGSYLMCGRTPCWRYVHWADSGVGAREDVRVSRRFAFTAMRVLGGRWESREELYKRRSTLARSPNLSLRLNARACRTPHPLVPQPPAGRPCPESTILALRILELCTSSDYSKHAEGLSALSLTFVWRIASFISREPIRL